MSGDRIIILRDRSTGKPIEISTNSIPKDIRPDNWFENPFWRYRPDREPLQLIIAKYYNKQPLSHKEVERLAQYIVDYACHTAVAVYLFGGGPSTLKLNAECIIMLRYLQGKTCTRNDLRKMIQVGRNYALDPL